MLLPGRIQLSEAVVITMFLTDAELKELTGYQRPKQIMRWLSQHGYRYEVAADGWPRVLP